MKKIVYSSFNENKDQLLSNRLIKILILTSKNKIISRLSWHALTLKSKLNNKKQIKIKQRLRQPTKKTRRKKI